MAERQFGPYKLVRQIAVGGMAEIHLAKTAGIAGFEKYVALKMIHPNFAEDEQFIQMLVDEAKIAVQLTHGNIAQTFDLGRVGETYYITMEYVDGADLYKILRRASEQDLEMPLDVCAFIGKEVSSALDHAHRKRDHTGKSLGIVHRDVSPQNVLVSYSGEVKLVDFGIAKATMKVRQTAAGVIKGKYYYMSPEQAWGEQTDHRSDIFSAGIVLYEMITGQMLYLEEDLHKLLEMARRAEIAPPSKLRRGVPPQLERIVMGALAKLPGERYQSAGDLATDLERFLHSYSPVFTASKLSTLLRQVVGEPIQVPDPPFQSIEFRDGVMSTHPLDDSEVAHAIDRDELRDENSVIFRVSELDRRAAEAAAAAPAPVPSRSPASTPPPMPVGRPASASTPPPMPVAARQHAPRATRPADSVPAMRPSTAKVPVVAQPPVAPLPAAAPSPARTTGKLPSITKPRHPLEETRQLDQPAPADPRHDDSGLLTTEGEKLSWESDTTQSGAGEAARNAALDLGAGSGAGSGSGSGAGLGFGLGAEDDLENIGERTLITGAPGMGGGGLAGFMMDVAGDADDGQVEATLITMAPPGFAGVPGPDTSAEAAPGDAGLPSLAGDDGDDEDGPTLPGDFRRPAALRPTAPVASKAKAPPPAALAAKIHAPAVSELRKPRPSRRTPPGGTPVGSPNVLQAIMSAKASEPMPTPRAPSSASAQHATVAMPSSGPGGMPNAMPGGMPNAMPGGMPNAMQGGMPNAMQGGMPNAMQSGMQQVPGMAPLPGMAAPGMAAPGMASMQATMPASGAMHPAHPAMQATMPASGAMPPSMQATMPASGAMHPAMQATMPQGDPYGFPVGTPAAQPSYNHDASGLPLAMPTPPGVAAHPPSGPYPGAHPEYGGPPLATQMSPHGYPQLSPGALYPFQPTPQPMSLTGQMRLFEVDEIPSQYKLGAARRRWFTYIVSGILAISVAAGVTFMIIRLTRETAPTTGSVHLESVPSGAEVRFDGTLLTDRTPLTIDGAPVGTRHRITISLPHYQAHTEDVDIPRSGKQISVIAQLSSLTGKILINTTPAGAEIRINGMLRGVTPTTISGIDIDSTATIELRHKEFGARVIPLKWDADGMSYVDYRFSPQTR